MVLADIAQAVHEAAVSMITASVNAASVVADVTTVDERRQSIGADARAGMGSIRRTTERRRDGYLENIMLRMEATHRDPATEQSVIRHTPLGRRAKLEEAPVVFLRSADASCVTGSIVAADGGYTAI